MVEVKVCAVVVVLDCVVVEFVRVMLDVVVVTDRVWAISVALDCVVEFVCVMLDADVTDSAWALALMLETGAGAVSSLGASAESRNMKPGSVEFPY